MAWGVYVVSSPRVLALYLSVTAVSYISVWASILTSLYGCFYVSGAASSGTGNLGAPRSFSPGCDFFGKLYTKGFMSQAWILLVGWQ